MKYMNKSIEELHKLLKEGKVNSKETEINNFSKYKGISDYIYFTGKEYIDFIHAQGLNW